MNTERTPLGNMLCVIENLAKAEKVKDIFAKSITDLLLKNENPL